MAPSIFHHTHVNSPNSRGLFWLKGKVVLLTRW
jgi:hypothetical protein